MTNQDDKVDWTGDHAHWRWDATDQRGEAVRAYASGVHMPSGQIAILRDYLRQWITTPVFRSSTRDLRETVSGLNTRKKISVWLARAASQGLYPLL